jgi:polyvinyl alcohol dehydrogenase (cytochrome)
MKVLHFRKDLSAGSVLQFVFFVASLTPTLLNAQSWPVDGANNFDWRYQASESLIGANNASTLAPQWVFNTQGDVSATPTSQNNVVYFPDWAGNLYAADAKTGTLIWSRSIASYNGQPNSIARVSPAIHDQELIIGDNVGAVLPHAGADIMAVDRATGNLLWITQVDAHPAAVITSSPTISGNTVLVGVSSLEEYFAAVPGYVCCTFRGSMVALNVNTGKILWKTYTVPPGYSGGAIWGTPAVDQLNSHSVYVGTGNNYSVPSSVSACEAAAGGEDPSCTAPDDYFDSAMSFDLTSGKVNWGHPLTAYDAWNISCSSTQVNCPVPRGPDYDFGSGPNFLGSNLVGFGQKSGIYWALNPHDGSIVWATQVGPGGTTGGIEFGPATDGKRIYVAITNSEHYPYKLYNGPVITWGSWAALDANTGQFIWQVADPSPNTDQNEDMGSVSVANGVLYAPSFSGYVYAINSATGAFLWSFNTGGTVVDGPALASGSVLWGSGYSHTPPGTPNNKVYSFTVSK